MVERSYGWRRQRLDHRDLKYEAYPIDPTKPVDLRPNFPAVYDQGQTGSCVGNATAGAIQYTRMAQSLPNWVPSRLFIYYNARVLEGTTDQDAGSEIRDAVKQVVKLGVCSEIEWPFDPAQLTTKPSDVSYELATHAKVIKYAAVAQKIDHLLSCLNHNLPIIFGCNVFDAMESENAARSGIITMPEPDEQSIGGHAMLIVGWKPDSQQFIVRNSWGSGWGLGGYCLFPRDYILNPDLSSDFWTVLLDARN